VKAWRAAVTWNLLWALGCACGGHDAERKAPAHVPSKAGEVAAPNALSPAPTQAGKADPGGAASKPLQLNLRVESSADGVGLHVLNPGPEAVALAPEVALERVTGGAPAPVDPKALRLWLNCDSIGCITLLPGAELVAPSWLGLVAKERCDSLLRPSAPGNYQLRVRRCQGESSQTVPFSWPSP
jgi:hypothetical protein